MWGSFTSPSQPSQVCGSSNPLWFCIRAPFIPFLNAPSTFPPKPSHTTLAIVFIIVVCAFNSNRPLSCRRVCPIERTATVFCLYLCARFHQHIFRHSRSCTLLFTYAYLESRGIMRNTNLGYCLCVNALVLGQANSYVGF